MTKSLNLKDNSGILEDALYSQRRRFLLIVLRSKDCIIFKSLLLTDLEIHWEESIHAAKMSEYPKCRLLDLLFDIMFETVKYYIPGKNRAVSTFIPLLPNIANPRWYEIVIPWFVRLSGR